MPSLKLALLDVERARGELAEAGRGADLTRRRLDLGQVIAELDEQIEPLPVELHLGGAPAGEAANRPAPAPRA